MFFAKNDAHVKEELSLWTSHVFASEYCEFSNIQLHEAAKLPRDGLLL